MNDHELHIASLFIQVRPETMPDLLTWLNDMPDLDVYAAEPNGRLIVVLETSHQRRILDRIDRLQEQPGVLGCSLIYHEVLPSEDADQELIAHKKENEPCTGINHETDPS